MDRVVCGPRVWRPGLGLCGMRFGAGSRVDAAWARMAGLGLREMWSRAERLAGVSLLGVSGADEKRAWDLGLGRHAAE